MTDDRTTTDVAAADASVAATRDTTRSNWSETITYSPATFAQPRCLAELREVVARSFPVTTYLPSGSDAWGDAVGRFGALVAGAGR